ncbi:hypothetical protein SAMN05216304_101428 [Bosea sp. OK403]|uniref:hypothetical protein n=1 Tax=Bosea sp. OK403 TaxID=1855286 RepID=UPI0008E65340|nr:hypothetical protein [Bosea sp. OK403]SFI01942.1 hypothetical protein SAMN05216304_101428 [Bosea sp. OK403]
MLATARSLVAAIAVATGSFAALAQGTVTPPQSPGAVAPQSNGGLGPVTTHPSQVDRGQNMILPSAGSSGQSSAPTMIYDCKAKPQDCTTPATPADKATAPQISAPPATTTP